ncbi:MAG: AraC family transcriptional regulator [Desulfobacula sp.]|nr:AraC family transcriptional regulator [Desulfobacula sp.]
MDMEPTIAASTFLSAFKILTESGINAAELEKKAGLTRQNLENPDIRIPVTQWNRFLEMGQQWSNDPAFALHLGRKISHERMSLVGHIVFNSRTAGEGLRQYIRFVKLANEGDRVALEINDNEVAVVYTTEDPAYMSSLAMERNFSVAVTRLRRYTNVEISPVRVEFQHPAPSYIDEYEQVFRSPILFERVENRLVFHKSVLALKLGKRSAHLYSGLLQYAESLMGKLAGRRTITKKVRYWINKCLAEGDLDIEKVAARMNMTRQTLYRKLKKEGTSFKTLLDDTRKSLAKKYLAQNEYSITEIAFFLGFSETSSFNRAFNRWYDSNPSDFRK